VSNEPNPFLDRSPWLRITFGGQLARAGLTKIDGVSTEDEWKEQTSKETSGRIWVFAGTKRGKPKLTFICWDDDSYAWLQEHWEMLKPVPNLGGGPSSVPVAPTGGTQYAAAAQVKPGNVGSPPALSKAGDFDIPDNAPTKVASVGPKPPTISVDYPSLARHNITALARAKWTDVGFTETNGYEVDIEYVAQDPPKLAGTGALAPAKPASPGSQFVGGGAAQAPGTGSPAATQAAGT